MKNLLKRGIITFLLLVYFSLPAPAWAGKRLSFIDKIAAADISSPYTKKIPYRLWEKIAADMAGMPQLQVSHFDRRFTFNKKPFKKIRLLQKEGRTRMVDYYAPASEGIINCRVGLNKNSVGGLVLARSTRDYRVIAIARKNHDFLLLGRVEANRCRWDYVGSLPQTGKGGTQELTVVFRGPVLEVFVNGEIAYITNNRPETEIYRIGTMELVDGQDHSGVDISHIRHRKEVEDEFNSVSYLISAHLQQFIDSDRADEYASSPSREWVLRPGIGKVYRTALLLPPSSKISFPVEIPPQGTLEFGLGVRSLGLLEDPLEEGGYFEVELIGESGQGIKLFSHDAAGTGLTRQWQNTKLDLSSYAGLKGKIVWSYKVEEDAIPQNIFFLANPTLTSMTPSPKKPPGVILYVIDSLRADKVGSFGGSAGITPAIDNWAENEIVFKTCYTQAPWSLPALISMFTSYYPYTHQAFFLGDRPGKDTLNLAQMLKIKGYTTASFSENIVSGRISGLDKGFDFIDYNQITGQRLKMWLEKNRSRPFFLYIHIQNPHLRYRPPDSFLPKGITPEKADSLNERFMELAHPKSFSGGLRDLMGIRDAFQEKLNKILPDIKRLYDGEISAADYRFGELVRILKDLHLEDETLMILTSNHGEEFDEHGELLHGRSLYNTSLHVPLILHLPGPVRHGMTISRPVGLIDILPTVLDVLGQDIPQTQGVSLLPAILGDPGGKERKIYAARNSFRAHSPLRGKKNTAMIDERWKAILNQDTDAIELYDIIADPEERTDLSEDYPNQAQAYKEQIFNWLEQQGVKPQSPKEQTNINEFLNSIFKH